MLKKYRIFVLENPQEICWLLSYWPILIPILFSSKIKYVSFDISFYRGLNIRLCHLRGFAMEPNMTSSQVSRFQLSPWKDRPDWSDLGWIEIGTRDKQLPSTDWGAEKRQIARENPQPISIEGSFSFLQAKADHFWNIKYITKGFQGIISFRPKEGNALSTMIGRGFSRAICFFSTPQSVWTLTCM